MTVKNLYRVCPGTWATADGRFMVKRTGDGYWDLYDRKRPNERPPFYDTLGEARATIDFRQNKKEQSNHGRSDQDDGSAG